MAGQTLAETRVELRTGQVHHLLLSKLPEHIELGFHFFVLFLNVKYVNFRQRLKCRIQEIIVYIITH